MLCFRFTPIIICRFTLNVRQVKSPGSSWISGSQSVSLRFVGDAGGLLQIGANEDEEGEEAMVEHPGHDGGSGSASPITGTTGDSMAYDELIAESVGALPTIRGSSFVPCMDSCSESRLTDYHSSHL